MQVLAEHTETTDCVGRIHARRNAAESVDLWKPPALVVLQVLQGVLDQSPRHHQVRAVLVDEVAIEHSHRERQMVAVPPQTEDPISMTRADICPKIGQHVVGHAHHQRRRELARDQVCVPQRGQVGRIGETELHADHLSPLVATSSYRVRVTRHDSSTP